MFLTFVRSSCSRSSAASVGSRGGWSTSTSDSLRLSDRVRRRGVDDDDDDDEDDDDEDDEDEDDDELEEDAVSV